ncbi:response regulator [Hydrogenophaga sp. PAMC20947]|uniref:response regulator n=1 Tax=Hydrogenophaga sp. PAMC20947 TaxID=2565558 RepID=UPI0014471626|nr:response regulator [Hydrogenophaga sp. PAMC20947]
MVDDEHSIVRALTRALKQAFTGTLQIESCTCGADALELLLGRRFDVIVSDLRMPGMGGMELLERAAALQPDCVRMILTGTSDFGTAQQALNGFGVYRYLTKPWETDDLIAHVGAAVKHGQLLRAQRDQALEWAASQGKVSPQDVERQRLESMEPGITRVEWDEDGCLVLQAWDDKGSTFSF